MSGGGNKVMKGRMSSTIHSDVSPGQLEEIEKKLEADEKALQVSPHSVHLWTFAKVVVALNFSRTSYVTYIKLVDIVS